MQSFSDSQDNQYQQPTAESAQAIKRLADIATIYQKFQLNSNQFQIKSHSYYRNTLLNGVTFSMSDGRGQSKYCKFIKLIDSTSIILYNGVQIMDYSISGRTSKPIKDIKNLLHLAYYQQIYTGRVFVAMLYNSHDWINIQIIDFLTKKTEYSQPIKSVSVQKIQILHFSICFQKKNFYLLIYQTSDQKTIAEVKSTKNQQPAFILQLSGAISNCHYNSDLRSYIFSRGDQLLILKDIGKGDNIIIEEKKLQQFNQDILYCKSHQNIVTVSTLNTICFFYLDTRQKQTIKISIVIEEYSDTILNIKSFQFMNGVLLVAFESLPVLFHFNITGDKTRIKKITFSSHNFVNFNSILIDPSSTTALLFTQHTEANVTEDFQELSLGQIMKNQHKQIKRPYIKSSILHLNILNTVYAMEYLPWETVDYVNIMVSPWNNNYFIQTKRKIIAQNWSFWIEEGLCSAIHPTSLLMAIGYRDCFKIYAIMSDRLSNINAGTNLKECTSLCYSPNGHHLAVASNNSIFIFDSYSHSKVGFIPQQNSPIKELKYDTQFLMSKAKNGNCYVYSISNGYNRLISFYPKDYLSTTDRHINFQYVQYDPIYDIFIVCWGNFLKFYTSKGGLQLFYMDMECKITTVHISRQLRTLFLGTSNGQIISFPWPNNPLNLKRKQPKRKVHEDAIQLIRITNDCKHIISVSTGGVLYVGNIKILHQTRQIRVDEISHQNVSKMMMSNLLKQHRLIFHSMSLNAILNDKIKDLGNQVNNDFLVHPIQEQKYSKIGATRLQKERQTLALKNQKQTSALDNQYGVLRYGIRDTRDKIGDLKHQFDIIKEENKKVFDQQQEILIKKRHQLEKMQYRIVQANRLQIRQLSESNKNQIQISSLQYQRILKNISQEAQNKNLQYDGQLQEFKIYKQQVQIFNQKAASKDLSAFLTEISQISYSNIQLLAKNSKIQRDINQLQFKIKDFKDPITDLEQQIKSNDPGKTKEMSQKQEEISQTANKSMKEKEYNYIRSIKMNVDTHKKIECLNDHHQELVDQIRQLQNRIHEIQSKNRYIQEQIVEQKTISLKNNKIQKGLKVNYEVLKSKKKIMFQEAIDSNNMIRKQIEDLTMKLSLNRVGELMPKKINTQCQTMRIMGKQNKSVKMERFKTEAFGEQDNIISESRASSSDKLKRSHTQLHKITRALYAHQRVGNTISNMKKIYNNHSVRAFDQNQDLLQYWNTLRFQKEKLKKKLNKTMENVQTLPNQSKEFLVKKKIRNTPFQDYCQKKNQSKKIKFKTDAS